MPRFVEVYDTDVYGRTKIYTGPGADGQWFTDDDVVGNVPLCRYLYTGREYDPETGLYYYRARYYSPELGRFISRDPLGYGGGSMGLYEYGAGNPAVNVDPSGEIIPLLVILGIVIVGALIAGAMNAVRQGIRYVETGQGWSWKEFGLATLIGGATAPFFVIAPEVMIPIAMGFGLASAINEYDAGHYATGTFDLLTSLLPLTSESVRSGSLWTRPGIVSRFQMRWTSILLEEPMLRHALRTGEPVDYAHVRAMEIQHGTDNVHASTEHGPWTTRAQQANRVLTGDYPTGRPGNPTSNASRFSSWRSMKFFMRRAIALQKAQPGQKEYASTAVGEVVTRIGTKKNPIGTEVSSTGKAIMRFDGVQKNKFYTAYPEEP
jgi:RHS repeat-associated protein